jgi:hypothetical protein
MCFLERHFQTPSIVPALVVYGESFDVELLPNYKLWAVKRTILNFMAPGRLISLKIEDNASHHNSTK